jgi:hypothetical protein
MKMEVAIQFHGSENGKEDEADAVCELAAVLGDVLIFRY